MDSEQEHGEEPLNEISLEGEFLSPGEKFGDYQVMNCLSFDLLGGVYRMQNIFQFTEVCMTVLHSEINQAPDFTSLLEEQLKNLCTLEHPNILKVTDVTEIKDRCCLIMEAVEGENICEYLQNFIKQQQQISGASVGAEPSLLHAVDVFRDLAFGLPVAHAVKIIKQTSDAFQAAHSSGIYHNSFNPTHLIRTSTGEIKVSGFGLFQLTNKDLLKKLSSAEIIPFNMGLRKVRINTGPYLPPELLAGGEGCRLSDIYSLGLTSFYLLTGRKPEGPSDQDNPAYKPPTQYSAAIPHGWDRVIARCLDAAPVERYKDAKGFSAAVDRLGKDKIKAADDRGIAQSIEKIPIPKSIAKKLDPEKLKYLRLGILGVIAALIIGVSNFCFNIIFSDDKQAAGPVVKRVAEGQTPLYLMTITPAKARVIFSGEDKGESSFVVSDGNLQVTMPRGDYNVRATSKDHRPRTYTIEVSREPIEITLELEPFWSLLEVITDPGAQVVAIRESGERIDLGKVPANGTLRAERTLYKGIYSLEVSRPKYKTTLLKDIDLPFSKLVTQKVVLEPAPGKLLVLTQPEGADVFLNGTNMGKTPLNLDELDVETPLSLEIALANYRPKKLTMNLPPGYDDSLDLGQLQRKAGIIEVQLSFQGATPEKLAQVEYRVEGKTFKEPSGRLHEVYEGNQNLEIEHPDYYLWDQKVRVADRRTTIVKAKLAPRPGRLEILLDSEYPFSVVANGQTVPHKDEIFEIPAERELDVEVQIRDHLSVRRKMRFAANEEQSWEVEAKPIPGPESTQEWTIPYIGTTMAWIKPGEFRLGSPVQEQSRLPNEGPATTVNFPRGFWMAKYEVTQSDYQKIMEKNPSEFKGLKHPVDHVTWQQAAEYCRKINQTEQEAGRLPDNYNYRLPTEAEWEYACRAGTSAPYSFGQQADQKLGNFKGGYPRAYGETLHISADKYGTVPVGSYAANPWGLYDMHGNVGEWCWDIFNSRYPGGMVENWSGPDEGSDKVYRGGSWGNFAHQCRSAARQRLRPGTASNLVGFRLVLAPALKP